MELDIGVFIDTTENFPLFNSVTNPTINGNETDRPLPIDMKFNEGHKIAIVCYSLLMITSAIGNLLVLAAIIRLCKTVRLTRINLFLLNLAIADLCVTFLMMPLEIGWNATVSWDAGDAVCRIMSFFRIFGLYLSGFVIICISLDRYFAIVKPLGIADANRRAKIMLSIAWIASIALSLPQPYIFHVENHPEFKWYEQCVTFNSFPSQKFELAYNFSGFFFLYIFPLAMIIICYSCILYKIYRVNTPKANGEQLRRSTNAPLGRAKVRTLKMTIMIVAAFFLCWTPYNVMSLWYWFDKKSAVEVDPRIQKALFLFACTNSCANPLIYGLFHFRKTQKSIMFQPSVGRRNDTPVRRANYIVRFRSRRPTHCCIVECGSNESSGGTPALSSSQGSTNHNHPYRAAHRNKRRMDTQNFNIHSSRRPTTSILASGSSSSHRSRSMHQIGSSRTTRERYSGSTIGTWSTWHKSGSGVESRERTQSTVV